MIQEYQINVAAKTQNSTVNNLASGWLLAIQATSKEGTDYRLVVQTCSAPGANPLGDHYENLNDDGVQLYAYSPAADNRKSENLMLTNNFEEELDSWFGSGNWSII